MKLDGETLNCQKQPLACVEFSNLYNYLEKICEILFKYNIVYIRFNELMVEICRRK